MAFEQLRPQFQEWLKFHKLLPYPKIQTNQSSFQSPFYSFTKISRTFY